MQTFIKTQAALIAGSLADFLLTWLLVDALGYWYVSSNAAGNVAGAVTQFLLSKYFIFTDARKKTSAQVVKFLLMWAGNIAISALFVYLLSNFLHLHYLLSKLIVSVVMGVSYTYLLSKRFVFA